MTSKSCAENKNATKGRKKKTIRRNEMNAKNVTENGCVFFGPSKKLKERRRRGGERGRERKNQESRLEPKKSRRGGRAAETW